MLFENFSVYKYYGLPLGGSIVGLMPNLGTGSCRFGVASPFRPKFCTLYTCGSHPSWA